MALTPPLPLQADAGYLGDPVLQQGPPPVRRSHLVERAPTGEPAVQVQQRDQALALLQSQIDTLRKKVEFLETYLADRTLRGRWRRLRAWTHAHLMTWKERLLRG